MQTTSTTARLSAFGPRIAERSRGTAHPAAMSQRDRVARSLVLRPEARRARR